MRGRLCHGLVPVLALWERRALHEEWLFVVPVAQPAEARLIDVIVEGAGETDVAGGEGRVRARDA